MKYIYGPVPSRRLGQSLGIDPIPSKTCNYQCIYCQLGKTSNFTNTRTSHIPKEDIIFEMQTAIKKYENKFNYVTFVGSGEPTLYLELKDLILQAKSLTSKPIAVITNGSLLHKEDIIEALMLADVILPSLDAGSEKKFIQINRPHPSLKFDKVIQGLINFRQNFKGMIWIEIMIMKGINDSREELTKIKDVIDLALPDRVDVNVPIRPPTEKWVKKPNIEVFNLVRSIFGKYYDLNFPEIGIFQLDSQNFEKELLNIIERHPMREEQIIRTFCNENVSEDLVLSYLDNLEKEKKIMKSIYSDKIYWKLA
jgi:wyosine [tRNA(Phe)-imidazoG37] synthetase (radical SAM superfamily)